MVCRRGARPATVRYGRRRTGLTSPSSLRLIMILGLVVGSMLGGGYVLARVLGTPGPPRDLLGASPAPSPDLPRTSPGPTGDLPGTPTAPSPSGAVAGSPVPADPPGTPRTSAGPGPDAPADPGSDAPFADDRPRLPMGTDGPYGSRLGTGSGYVALTFDDGPNPQYTPQVLAELERHRVRATFCLVGELAAAYPELVRAIAAAGHTLCNHSWSHDPVLGRRTKAAIRADLTRTNEAIRAAVPQARIAYYRQPYGYWTTGAVATAWELGMTSVHWDVDSKDYDRPGAGSIASNVTAGVTAGSIVLMHDAGGNRQQTVSALRTILPNLVRRFALESLPTGPSRGDPDRPG
ncbi:polysaccharide deacetylase family protein [Micromonospora sp. NPDC049523]|uniref:polysaccharide deacetylase family protein n=1 Tax=Micromonospora sp. NPDC049523 TaxID=3155921 RepID=UPI003445B1D2